MSYDVNADNVDGMSAASLAYRQKLVQGLTFEVVPISTIDSAIEALPPGSEVSVTCSPVKGIETTIELSDQIRNMGHTVIPHIAARMVESKQHVADIASWLRVEDIGRLFLVGGDADPAAGPYTDAVTFLKDLLDAQPNLHTVGVTAYPDGHSFIGSDLLSEALHAKQAVLREANLEGYASTQMCFDANKIASWLGAERNNGLELPIHLGIAGVVDRAKLMKMGVRLGVGNSLRYLKKNRKAISQLMTRGDYDPNALLDPLSEQLEPLRISGIHCFTFNQVAATETWRQDNIA